MLQQQPKIAHLDPHSQQAIQLKRQLIKRIKDNHHEKLTESHRDVEDQDKPYRQEHSSTESVIDPASVANYLQKGKSDQPVINKNPDVSDTDRMLFDKKFKNYLNHRQQYLDRARGAAKQKNNGKGDKKPQIDIGEAGYYNEEEVLSHTGSEYQYQDANDMQAAYEQMTTGKKGKGGKIDLYPPQLFENQLRRFQFQCLLAESEEDEQICQSISKDRLLNYLFDEPIMMMLYSINPYQLGDELAEFETNQKDLLNYLEFSKFLIADREPTYFQYTQQHLIEARKLGRGIKCAPIIAKWIDDNGIFEMLVDTYKSIDIRGDSQVDRVFLAKKLRKQAQDRRLTQQQVIEIMNINKKMPLNRLLYEIQFEEKGRQNNSWSQKQFIEFLTNYKRKKTPEKDKLITKLILTGKYDSSYVYVVSQQALQVIKDVFSQTAKYAQYFVLKQKFIQNLTKDPRYKKIQGMFVRSQTNRYVKKETVEQTLIRIYAEGQTYLDIEEVLDFFTNRGRPIVVEYRVYLENLKRQLAIIEQQQLKQREKYGDNCQTAGSDEQFDEDIRNKQKKRKSEKLKQIRQGNNFDTNKKFNVTIPIPFGFDTRDKAKKESIREKKFRLMMEEKEKKYQQQIKPIPPKQVPYYVKENMYERMLKQQERERKERLQKFRLEIMAQVKVSDRLVQPKSQQIHCDFSSPQFKFAARPMPWYCEVNLCERINKKKQERRQKILEEIINKHSDYDLPQGVQKMIEREEDRAKKRAQKAKTASTGSVGECTFIPRISQGVPDFNTIHQHLHFDLQNAKNVKKPIEIVPFSFDGRPHKSKTTYQKAKPKQQRMRLSKYEKVDHQEQYQNIPKTQKFQALVELRRKQLQQREQQIQKEKNSQALRQLRKSKFAPVVWSALRHSKIDPSKSRAMIADRIKQFKRQERKKKEEYENQMIRILTKVYDRPLLLESGAEERGPRDSNFENRGEVQNEEEYLDAGYYGQEPRADLKLMLDRQRKGAPPHMDDDHRRAAVENHHLGQYPPEGFEMGSDEQDQDYNQEMYEQQYEQGNLHTS